MADNVNVSNNAFDAYPHIPTRTSETASSQHIQHVRLDLGVGTAEAQATGTVPTCADFISGAPTTPTSVNLDVGVDAALTILADLNQNSPVYKATGEQYAMVGSTDNTLANAAYLLIDSSKRAQVSVATALPAGSNAIGTVTAVGDVAHDAADSGNPIKIGGKAIDMLPDTDAEQGPSDVTANDRVNALFDLKGRLLTVPNARYNVLDNVSTTYNNTTTTATSTAIVCWQYRQFSLSFNLTRANSPTEILFQIEVSFDGTNYHVLQNDFWASLVISSAVAANSPAYSFTAPLGCQKIRLKVTATGTTASATFTLSNAAIYLRD